MVSHECVSQDTFLLSFERLWLSLLLRGAPVHEDRQRSVSTACMHKWLLSSVITCMCTCCNLQLLRFPFTNCNDYKLLEYSMYDYPLPFPALRFMKSQHLLWDHDVMSDTLACLCQQRMNCSWRIQSRCLSRLAVAGCSNSCQQNVS